MAGGTTLTDDARPWGQNDQRDDAAARRSPGAADLKRRIGCPGPAGTGSAPPEAGSRRDQADHNHLSAGGKWEDLAVACMGRPVDRRSSRRVDVRRPRRAGCAAVLAALRSPAATIDPQMQPTAVAGLDGDQLVDMVRSELDQAELLEPVVLI